MVPTRLREDPAVDVIPAFSQRAQDVARAFSFTGATPPAAADMDRADQDVANRVADLEDRLADTGVDLEALAVKATSGKAADVKALRESLMARQAVNTPAYRRAVRAAATQFRRDLDRKEWDTANLVKSMLPAARAHMEHVTTVAVDSLTSLPANIQTAIVAGRTSATHVTRGLDLASATGEQVEAAQTCEWAWRIIGNTWAGDYERQALAVHRGRPTSPEAEEAERRAVEQDRKRATAGNEGQDRAPRHGEMDPHVAKAVWANVQAMEALASGMGSLEAVVLGSHGSVNGLFDPYGKDAEELNARLEAYAAVRGWLQTQADNRAGKSQRHPGDYSGTGSQALYRQAGYTTPEAALNDYRAHRAG